LINQFIYHSYLKSQKQFIIQLSNKNGSMFSEFCTNLRFTISIDRTVYAWAGRKCFSQKIKAAFIEKQQISNQCRKIHFFK